METPVWATPYQSRFGATEIQTLPESEHVSIAEAAQAEADLLAISTADFGVDASIGSILSPEKQISDDKVVPPFFTGYLLKNAHQTIELKNKERVVLPDFKSHKDVVDWLSAQALDSDNALRLLQLGSMSQKDFIEQASQWYADGSPDDSKPDVSMQLVNIDPAASIQRLKELSAAKRAVRQFATQQKQSNSEASKAWIAIYLANINALIANHTARMRPIVEQAALYPDEYQDILTELETTVPRGFLSTIVTIDGDDRMSQLYRRLDYVRNGFADNNTLPSTVVNEQITDNSPEQSADARPALFDSQAVKDFQEIEVTPEKAEAIIEQLFLYYGLYEKGWKHEFNSSKQSYAVNPRTRTFEITTNTRTLANSTLVGFVHEFSHVFQAINDEQFPYKIGTIKGKRSTGIREAGAIANERAANALLFGASEAAVPNMSYAHALQALEGGGSILDAMTEFAKEKDVDGNQTLSAGALAADRVIRLVRMGFSSQSMVYAEGSVFERNIADISSKMPGVGVNITSLDLPDQMRLQMIGALPEAAAPFDLSTHLAVVLQIISETYPELRTAINNAINELQS